MSGRRMKVLRRVARATQDPEQNKMLVRRYRVKIKAPDGTMVEDFRDTHFWPAGSFRRIYQDSKHG